MNKSAYARRVALSAVAAVLSTVATYALLRAHDVLFKPQQNPATMVATAHIPMFWRLGVGAYLGGAVALLVFFATAQRMSLVAKVVAAAFPIVAAAIAVQGLFLP